ncbi:uncharacterized protein LOC128092827 [Culex pipiens pallens]|uniref:uncharacterized protein LOC128092827 n=1 Tax=Culex pipiens pallens TaxID=42434 RepID=UPI0022AB328B|nr:uncharacterized protein LOC128092827 [Culex pipiens pallens]
MKNHKNLLKDFVSLSRSWITTGNSNKSVACSASLNLPQHSSLKIGPRRTLGLELMPIRDHFRKWSELMAGFDSNFKMVLVQTSFAFLIDCIVSSANVLTGLTAGVDSVPPAGRTKGGNPFKVDGLIWEAAPLKSILEVEVAFGIAMVTLCFGIMWRQMLQS